ncbi:MAG: hypothetical protein VX493_05390 [Candidatus Thermoplasmatota archaeon]|nr:hypothetical protein [Candidatus Thermoplasmatota archaeon]
MTRAHALFACLILIAAPLAGCLSGDDLEELVDDIIGCMDENAANYEENATSELVGDCIYMATMDTFMDAMSDVRTIEEMLEDTPKAGYSQSINMNEWNDDLGMQVDIQIDETVMADLDNDAVHVHNFLSLAPLLTMSYTHTQIGEVVNIHYAAGGMVAEGGESGSYQTRDATPNVLEVLADQVGLFSGGEEAEGMPIETPDSDVDEIPEDAVITITMSDDMESQTMTMEYTEDGAEITMTIHINQNEDLMSFTMASDNGSATMNMEYQMMWGDAVVIEVDETLPKTSIPVWVDIESWGGDDADEDDTFYCDNGNEIPMDYVDDGWDDCGDGSDESEPEMICWNSYVDYFDHFADQDTCYSWMWLENYTSEHDPDGEPFTGCYNSHTHTQNEWMSEEECTSFMWVDEHSFDDDDDTFYCDNGNEIPMEWVNDGDNDCGDWSDEDEIDINWESYYGGYCEWEGYPDGDDTVWWCKESQDDEYWETWWYYCEHHDSDWHCTDDFGQSEEFEHSADGDEWSGSDDDGDGAPTPEEAMESVDANDDGYMSFQEFQDSWDSDPTNPELDYDEVSILFDDCDYDGSDLIDIDEMQCFIDGIVDMLPDGGDECDTECVFHHIDGWLEDMDEHVTPSEWAAFVNSTGEEMSEEDFEGLSGFIGMYDYDDSEGLDWDEFQDAWNDCCADDDDGEEMFTCDNGDEIPMDWVNDGEEDCEDGSDEFDDGDDDNQQEMPAVLIGYIAKNQTLNAPISDFETHFLSDCHEEYDEETDEWVEPDLDECTVEFSIPLAGGEANGVTHTYTDLDGDGLVSPGDMLTLEGWDGQTRLEMYDTWASEYTSESVANPPVLPGFGALMALTVLLGAAFATRRD